MAFKYIDLHIHTVFKTLFRERENQVSGWENIEVPDGIFGNCFDSQSSLRMMFQKGNINLACVSEHAPERGMVNNIGTRIAAGMPGYKKFLEKTRLDKMGKSDVDYQQIHGEELCHLSNKEVPSDQRCFKIKPLTPDLSQYDRNDMNTLHIVFNIEGAHMFYEERNCAANLSKMIDIFRSYTRKYHLLYVTVAHLTPNAFSNHADGNKILPNEETWPKGRGIFPNGMQLIDAIYNEGVLVDIKHMSWIARQDLYKERGNNKNWGEKPLIASHAALTGFKFTDRKNYMRRTRCIKEGGKVVKIRYKKKGGLLKDTWFNPNSINLYDEDVVEVLKSKGLIGMNMDKRILGASEKMTTGTIKKTEIEFISCEESVEWLAKENRSSPRFDKPYTLGGRKKDQLIPDKEDQEESDDEFYELFPAIKPKTSKDKKELHLRFFCNQLLKIKQIAKENEHDLPGINPWDHICIGSDFDGLISTIHCCRNVTEMKSFAGMVKDNLQNYAGEAGMNLDLKLSVAEIVDKIFFENAFNFLTKHFHL